MVDGASKSLLRNNKVLALCNILAGGGLIPKSIVDKRARRGIAIGGLKIAKRQLRPLYLVNHPPRMLCTNVLAIILLISLNGFPRNNVTGN